MGKAHAQLSNRILRRRRDSLPQVCAICGSREHLTLDHIVPVSKGGAGLDRRNLVILCAPCNSKKADAMSAF